MFKPVNLARASGMNFLFLVFNSLIFLVFTPMVLLNMGTVNYGIWVMLLAFSQIANLATFGIGSAVEKFVAQSSHKNQSEEFSACVTFGFVFVLILGFLTSIIVWSFRSSFAALIQKEDAISIDIIAKSIGLISFSLLPQFLLHVSKGIFLGLVKNFWAGFFDFFQTSMMWLGVYFLTITKTDIIQLASWVFGLNVFCLLFSILVLFRIFHEHGFHPTKNIRIIRAMIRQSYLTWFSSLGITLFQNFDRIIVGYFVGAGAAGVYSLASSLALRLNILIGQFSQVLTPIASRWQADGLEDTIGIIYKKFLRFFSWFLFFFTGLIIIWMPAILTYWISPEFSNENHHYFQILFVIYSIFSLSRPANQILTGLGYVYLQANIFFFSGVISLLAIAVGSLVSGLSGAIIANTFYCSVLLVNIVLEKKIAVSSRQTMIDISIPSLLLVSILLTSFYFPQMSIFSIFLTIALIGVMIIFLIKYRIGVDYFSSLYEA